MIDLTKTKGFDWDDANTVKIIDKHEVMPAEVERIFFNAPLLLMDDIKHSQKEERFHALGISDERRLLHVTFTLRAKNTLIRVISARDMHRKERKIYEQTEENS
jgi:uncharacterized DUF497 family protein